MDIGNGVSLVLVYKFFYMGDMLSVEDAVAAAEASV